MSGARSFYEHSFFHSITIDLCERGNAWHAFSKGHSRYEDDANARAGSGVWFGDDDPRNTALRLPGPHQSNQTGEVLAIWQATRMTPPFVPLNIVSDSRYAIGGLTTNLQAWQDRGWIGVANAEEFQAAAYELRRRSAVTTLQWVKGHSDVHGNAGADELAGAGARKATADDVDLSVPEKWQLTGAKLTALTQALAYEGIRQRKAVEERPQSLIAMEKAMYCVRDHLSGRLPTHATVWHSLRHKDISRNISDFLWKVTHNAYLMGHRWTYLGPQYALRATCAVCHEEETMEHVLIDCDAPERDIVWDLAKRLWRKKHDEWPGTRLGNILGCALASFHSEDGKRKPGASRLYRILISESAYLIWKLRCERRIERDDDPDRHHSRREVENRWYRALNQRLAQDKELTREKYGKKKLKKSLVRDTWCGILKDEHLLPDDWTDTGFLVSIGPLQQ